MTSCLKILPSNPNVHLLLCLACVLACGCSEDMTIRQYKVAKSEARRVSPGTPEAAQIEQQMLAALVPFNNSAWAFKLTGAPNKVAATQDPFKQIVTSVKFQEGGNPSWQLPSGWTETRSGGMTFAKLQNPEQGLTATVTEVAVLQESDDPWQKTVYDNINRWRGQLSLPQQDWSAMQAELLELPGLNQGKDSAYYVSLVGKGSSTPAMGGPFSGGAPASAVPRMSANPAAPPVANGPAQLQYIAPDGWEESGASGMRLAAFKIKQGDLLGEVTVISAGGDTLSNVGRWQRQLIPDAPETLVQQVIDDALTVDVNGLPSQIYFIRGKDGPAENAFLASIIAWQPTQALFVKYTGPQALAESRREQFVEFVKSIKW